MAGVLNLLRPTSKFVCNLQKLRILGSFSRSSETTTWHKDWKPGPYPKTQEERNAAAKKYGLIPEDYEPYPEEESYGDYPKLPAVSAEARDPHENYDFPIFKRNYGEPLHVYFTLYGENMLNVNAKYQTPPWLQIVILCSLIGGFGIIAYLSDKYKIERPLMPKQFPYSGEKHYTFEPENS